MDELHLLHRWEKRNICILKLWKRGGEGGTENSGDAIEEETVILMPRWTVKP